MSYGLCAYVWPPTRALGHCVRGPVTPLCCCHSIPLAKDDDKHAKIQTLVMEGTRVDRVIVFASLLGIVQERKYNDAGWIEGKKPMYTSVME